MSENWRLNDLRFREYRKVAVRPDGFGSISIQFNFLCGPGDYVP